MSDGLHITDAEAAIIIYAAGLDPQLEARARTRAAECAECAAKLDSVRASDRSAGALLALLDVPAPNKSAAAIVQKAKAPSRISLGVPRRAAAGFIGLLVLAGVAAAALPSSPLHRLLVGALGGKVGAPPNTGRASSAPATQSGVSILSPAALEIVFTNRNAGAIHLRVTDGDQVALRSTDVAATYRVGSSRITVTQPAPADFHLNVPRGLRELRILAGDKLIFARTPVTRMTTDTLTLRLLAQPRD